MVRKKASGEALHAARKRMIIEEAQTAIARELARHSEVPRTTPQRITDLLRELHRRLRNADQGQP